MSSNNWSKFKKHNILIGKTGFIPIVKQPTRGTAFLDRIYTSVPCYTSVQVVTSAVKSDHKDVVARHSGQVKLSYRNGKYEHVDWSIHHEMGDSCQPSSSMWQTRIHQFKMTSTDSTKYSYKHWTNSTLRRWSPYQLEIQNTWPLQSKPSLEKKNKLTRQGVTGRSEPTSQADWKRHS